MSGHDVWRREGAVGWITFDRPEQLNGWTEPMGHAVLDALDGPASDAGVRAVVVTGAGRAFSAGADLDAWEPGRVPDVAGPMRDLWNPLVLALRGLEKPVVAAVNGPAAGFGASLVLACDFVVMAQSAFLQFAFSQVGLMPDGGASLLLPAAVGRARAARIAMLGERIGAQQAVEWGLADSVHDDAQLTAAAGDLAGRLAAGPTRAYAAAKAAFDRAAVPLGDQLAYETGRQQELMHTRDFAEGVAAFKDKRPARFTGA